MVFLNHDGNKRWPEVKRNKHGFGALFWRKTPADLYKMIVYDTTSLDILPLKFGAHGHSILKFPNEDDPRRKHRKSECEVTKKTYTLSSTDNEFDDSFME